MSSVEEYRRQVRWRHWGQIIDALPGLQGLTVLDLGCGVGDVAELLTDRGARVTGFDVNQQFIDEARSRRIGNAEFYCCDLRDLPDMPSPVDGIWCSFAAAYFVNLPEMLRSWTKHLKTGGWLALIEIDNLFGHAPLTTSTRSMLEAYGREALNTGRYDFWMGRKLQGYAEQTGHELYKLMDVEDQELSFEGAAHPDVIDAWRTRLARMKLLQDFCGDQFPKLQEEFLASLQRQEHRSEARVCCCIATKRAAAA